MTTGDQRATLLAYGWTNKFSGLDYSSRTYYPVAICVYVLRVRRLISRLPHSSMTPSTCRLRSDLCAAGFT